MEMAIDPRSDGTIAVGESQALFDDTPYTSYHMFTNYDVSSDERFLMIKDAPPTQINVILNFSEELKRLAQPGKQ